MEGLPVSYVLAGYLVRNGYGTADAIFIRDLFSFRSAHKKAPVETGAGYQN